MKKLNINNLIWFIVLLCYTLFFASLLYTGRINLFIHPKMHKYTMVALIAFIILSGFQFTRIFHEDDAAEIKLGYLILILPIAIGIAYKPKALNGRWVEVRGLNLLQVENICQDHKEKSSMQEVVARDNIILLNDKNYVDTLSVIYKSKENYKGKKIIFEGFVYKQHNIGKNQFITARTVVNCCAADAQVIGFICKYDGSNGIQEDQWVRVTGTIDTTKYIDENYNKEGIIPQILVEHIEEIKEPENKNIYH